MQGVVVGAAVAVLFCAAVVSVLVGAASPDPAKWLLHQSGFFALVFMIFSLAVSPVARAVSKPALVLWRRPLGLAGFCVATTHAVVYATAYQGLLLSAILEDIVKRPYILIGLTAWLLLIPLAATSTRNARRRMGATWRTLHRAVYVIVPLSVIHQGMAQKADLRETIIFSALVACFLIERLVRANR